MVERRNEQPKRIPPDDGSFSQIQNEFEDCYSSIMDSSFAALGRTITLHLQPERAPDTSGVQAGSSALHYNPFMGRAPRRAPTNISTTRSPAVRFVHRDVDYVAHIKHGPKDDDDTGGVSLDRDQVMTTTVIESLDDIDDALTATIDGDRYRKESSRKIGLRDARYVITTWRRVNEEGASG